MNFLFVFIFFVYSLVSTVSLQAENRLGYTVQSSHFWIPAFAVHNFDDKMGLKSCEDRVENKFGFIAERLEVCFAVKRMFAVFNSILLAVDERRLGMTKSSQQVKPFNQEYRNNKNTQKSKNKEADKKKLAKLLKDIPIQAGGG